MGLSMSPQVHAGFNEFDHEDVIACAEPRYADKLVMMADMARQVAHVGRFSSSSKRRFSGG